MTWLDDVALETVIVHLTNGASIRALKQAVHDDCIVLREALVYQEDADTPEQLNGLQVIPRESVLFIQAVT